MFLYLLITSLWLSGQVQLTIEPSNAVLGEPLVLQGRICNQDNQYWILDLWRLILVDAETHWEEYVDNLPGEHVDIGDPFWRDTIHVDAGQCRTEKAGMRFSKSGDYRVKWVYRPKEPYWKETDHMYKHLGGLTHMLQSKLTSQEVEIRIAEPRGEDKKAWDWMLEVAREQGDGKYNKEKSEEVFARELAATLSSNQWGMKLTGKIRKGILERFPSSTYAGWVLVVCSPGAKLEWENGKALIDDMLKPVEKRKRWGDFVLDPEGKNYPKTKDGKYFIKSAEEEAREFIQYAEPFVKAHPNHIKSAVIYKHLSTAYMVLHQWQKAYNAGQQSLNLGWDIEGFKEPKRNRMLKEKKVFEEALKELNSRGLAKSSLLQ